MTPLPSFAAVTASSVAEVREELIDRAMVIARATDDVAPVLLGEHLKTVSHERVLAAALILRTGAIREFFDALDETDSQLVPTILMGPRLERAIAELRRAAHSAPVQKGSAL